MAKQENLAYCGAFELDSGKTLAIDIPLFCRNVVSGARDWLGKVGDTPRFKANTAETLQLFQLSFEG